MQRPWRHRCWLLTCFLWLARIEPSTTISGVARMGPPYQSLIDKMPFRWILWRHFLNWSSLLSDDSSMYQVDIGPAGLLVTFNPLGFLISSKNIRAFLKVHALRIKTVYHVIHFLIGNWFLVFIPSAARANDIRPFYGWAQDCIVIPFSFSVTMFSSLSSVRPCQHPLLLDDF